MKLRYIFLSLTSLIFASRLSASAYYELAGMTELDTIVFDLSQAAYSNVDGISYVEFPVMLYAVDPAVNAVDYWFQFDLNKLTYESTTSMIAALDVFSNFNSNNQYLSNTSSTTSISVYLPLYVPIMNLKFSLNGPCTDVLETDFYSPTALLNGIVSSYMFIAPQPPAPIEVVTGEPRCADADIAFTYPADVSGHPITNYDWDFGNGLFGSGQTASTIYDEGSYTVTLTATTVDGCVHTLTSDVVILPSPVVSFTSSYDVVQNMVSFTNLSTITSGTMTYDWDFGDDTSSDLFEPTHNYPTIGTYDATLTVTSDLGCSTNVTNLVNASNDIVNLDRSVFLKIYPNPTLGDLNIHSSEELVFFIVDQTGRRVTRDQLLGANQVKLISLDYLANGLYMVVGQNDHSILNERFEIRR